MDMSCIEAKVSIWYNFSELHTLGMHYAHHVNILNFKKQIHVNNIPYPYPTIYPDKKFTCTTLIQTSN
jgi:hypothetical protein